MRIHWQGRYIGHQDQHRGGEYLWVTTQEEPRHPHICVTQLPTESVEIGTTSLRVTQLAEETVEQGATRIRVTQLPVEYIYSFVCGPTPTTDSAVVSVNVLL